MKLKKINSLSSIELLINTSKALAMLDTIIMDEWEFRYFSFNSKWDASEMMASMRDGSGSEYFILFTPNGAIGKVFIGEDTPELNINESFNKIPNELNAFLNEPAIKIDNTSFLFWRLNNINYWESTKKVDNDYDLLGYTKNDAKLYHNWAQEYYEREIDLAAVESIYRLDPLTDKVIKKLNSSVSINSLIDEIKEIDFPIY